MLRFFQLPLLRWAVSVAGVSAIAWNFIPRGDLHLPLVAAGGPESGRSPEKIQATGRGSAKERRPVVEDVPVVHGTGASGYCWLSPNVRAVIRTAQLTGSGAFEDAMVKISNLAKFSGRQADELRTKLREVENTFFQADVEKSVLMAAANGDRYVKLGCDSEEANRRTAMVIEILRGCMSGDLSVLGSDLLSNAFSEFGARERRIYVETDNPTRGNAASRIVLEELSSGRSLGRSFYSAGEVEFERYLQPLTKHTRAGRQHSME